MRGARHTVIVAGVRLDHRIHSAYGRARLADALHDVALDAIHPWARGSVAECEWLRDTLARPIRVASEAALGTLAAEVERALIEQGDATDEVTVVPADDVVGATSRPARCPAGARPARALVGSAR